MTISYEEMQRANEISWRLALSAVTRSTKGGLVSFSEGRVRDYLLASTGENFDESINQIINNYTPQQNELKGVTPFDLTRLNSEFGKNLLQELGNESRLIRTKVMRYTLRNIALILHASQTQGNYKDFLTDFIRAEGLDPAIITNAPARASGKLKNATDGKPDGQGPVTLKPGEKIAPKLTTAGMKPRTKGQKKKQGRR